MRFIDPHIHCVSRTTDDYIYMSRCGVVAVPISDSQKVIGVFELFTRADRQVNDDTARALHDTVVAVGRLIERHREH